MAWPHQEALEELGGGWKSPPGSCPVRATDRRTELGPQPGREMKMLGWMPGVLSSCSGGFCLFCFEMGSHGIHQAGPTGSSYLSLSMAGL